MTDDLRAAFPPCEDGSMGFVVVKWPDTFKELTRRTCWRGGRHEVDRDRCRACKEAEKGEVKDG